MTKRLSGVILTPREEQVLRHVRLGESNKEIAATLGIGEQAVKAIVSRLLLKFVVPNRTTLAAVADYPQDGPSANTRTLHDALSRSRELRSTNKVLMAQMRRELREFQNIRKRLLDRRAASDGHDRSRPTEPLPRRRPQSETRGTRDAR